MIVTKKKPFEEILKHLKGEKSIFIVGCGVCADTCQTGGEKDVLQIKELLEKEGLRVTGYVVPEYPCAASQIRIAFARNRKAVDEADSILVLACGLGAQSVKDNLFKSKPVHIGCDTLFMGQIDKTGILLERCSGCGDCVLEMTDCICPVTRCPKGLLNGPCGGQDKGKCEVDKDIDCVWVEIYKELEKKNKLYLFKEIQPPKDFSKMRKPRQVTVG